MIARAVSVLAIVASLTLILGASSASATPSRGAVRCDQGQDLQAAIEGARSGGTLRIHGECVGTFVVAIDLRLRGVDGGTLRGPFEGTILTIGPDAEVTIVDLTITGGRPNIYLPAERRAGGIYNEGNLTLAGSTTVTGNTDYSCGTNPPPRSPCHPDFPFSDNIDRTGGIINMGTLALRDWATVTENHGGVRNGGAMTMKGRASVTNNRAIGGAGIANGGHLTVEGEAAIHGNAASSIAGSGGGISNSGTVVLKGRASVSENYGGQLGGGVINGGLLVLEDSASVVDNEASTGDDIFNAPDGAVELGRRSWVGALFNLRGTIGGFINRVAVCTGC